ncbi:MAG: hypothetical protein KAI43_12735 [Candidatus Aureabacteria bacterium]|nr:hypothetical protein [Candidatus Auribacterota bacterium]
MKNKRKIFINNKIITYIISLSFLGSCILGIIYLFLFVLIPSTEEPLSRIFFNNDLLMLKYVVMIFVIIFGILCFSLGYVYTETAFLGIFKRMSNICKNIKDRDEKIKMTFRKNDKFEFFADDFNEMVETLKKETKEKDE